MQDLLTAGERRYDEQQRTDRALAKLETRQRLKSFVLVCGLILLAVAVGSLFASLGSPETMRL